MMRATPILVALVLLQGVARADLSAPAQAKLDVGLVQYQAGHYEAAIVEFEAAYEIDPDPSLLFTWAQAERLADHCDVAVPRYRTFIASRPSAAAVDLANNGIALCEAAGKGIAPGCAPEVKLPWYKNPVGGAVVAGVVGFGVGIGFLIAASGNRDSADHATTSDVFDTYLDRATTERRVGVTFLVIGAGLVGGGLGYHYWTKRSRSRAVVGTTGTSLFVAGEF